MAPRLFQRRKLDGIKECDSFTIVSFRASTATKKAIEKLLELKPDLTNRKNTWLRDLIVRETARVNFTMQNVDVTIIPSSEYNMHLGGYQVNWERCTEDQRMLCHQLIKDGILERETIALGRYVRDFTLQTKKMKKNRLGLFTQNVSGDTTFEDMMKAIEDFSGMNNIHFETNREAGVMKVHCKHTIGSHYSEAIAAIIKHACDISQEFELIGEPHIQEFECTLQILSK